MTLLATPLSLSRHAHHSHWKHWLNRILSRGLFLQLSIHLVTITATVIGWVYTLTVAVILLRRNAIWLPYSRSSVWSYVIISKVNYATWRSPVLRKSTNRILTYPAWPVTPAFDALSSSVVALKAEEEVTDSRNSLLPTAKAVGSALMRYGWTVLEKSFRLLQTHF